MRSLQLKSENQNESRDLDSYKIKWKNFLTRITWMNTDSIREIRV